MELKKITAAMRGDASPDPHDEREVSATWLRERMRKHADALDALAAQETAMVAACCGRTECGGECGNEWRGMQPAPQQPAVPESFEKALSDLEGAIQFGNIGRIAIAHAAVLALYSEAIRVAK